MNTASTLPLDETPPPHYDINPANLEAARFEFVELMGSKNIEDDRDICFAHASSRWAAAPPSHSPHLIVYPHTTEEVSSVLNICSRRSIPVTPYCGGTGLSGCLAATRGGICIDFKNMTQIWGLHENDMDITVQPGVRWMDLNAHLAEKELFFPPDPAPDARIGGMIAMGCSGTNAYRYGTMRDWVISMTAVLADGSIVKTGNRPRKSSAGYDLSHLIIGSEGTLAIVTEAVLKLTRAPKNIHVAILPFDSTHAAVDTAISIMSSGEVFDAVEFVDRYSLEAVNQSGLVAEKWREAPTLFLKFSGVRQSDTARIQLIEALAARDECLEIAISSDVKQVEAWWNVRKLMAKCLVASLRPNEVFLASDAAVPMSRLADMIVETQKATVDDSGFFCSTLGHIGDGNVHVAFFCPQEERAKGEQLVRDVQRRALRMEGTITGEHGIGLSLRDVLVEEVGNSGVNMMRRIKLALDPGCILNCNKVIRMEA